MDKRSSEIHKYNSGSRKPIDDVNKVTIVSNGLRLHADQFDKLGLALTKAYMCDTCKKVILDTYVTDE